MPCALHCLTAALVINAEEGIWEGPRHVNDKAFVALGAFADGPDNRNGE